MQAFDFKNQIYLYFFLLKHIKGSPEAAFDDLFILADVNGVMRLPEYPFPDNRFCWLTREAPASGLR